MIYPRLLYREYEEVSPSCKASPRTLCTKRRYQESLDGDASCRGLPPLAVEEHPDPDPEAEVPTNEPSDRIVEAYLGL